MRRLARPLLYVGIAAIVAGFAKLHASAIGHYDLTSTVPSRAAWTIAYVALLAATAYGMGLPDLPRSGRSAVSTAIAAPAIAAVAMSVVQLLAGDALLPRFVVFGAALAVAPWCVLCTAIASGGRLRAEERDRVVVVGDPAEVEALRAELERAPERPAILTAVLTPTQARPEDPKSRPLCERVIADAATVVVLDRAAQSDETVVAQAAALHEAGVRVRTLSLFYEEWLGKLPLIELERVSLMFDIGELHRARYGRFKRIFDVVLSVAAGAVLVVAIPFVLLGNLVGNRGPLFYRQPRVGKNGRLFDIVKFRTMRPAGAGDVPNEWTTEDDPRITRFGRILRLTHLDELPQVVNILRGDLSVVGPRPEQPHYVEELTAKLPFYGLRHLVRPGLTGWAQVKYGYAGSESDALEKLQYEFFYLRHQDLALDVRIVGRTLRSVLGREGR